MQSITGLSATAIAGLQQQFGKNSFREEGRSNLLYMIGGMIKEPMFIILLAACLLYFILGEAREGFMMLLALVFVAAISVYQEIKSSRALAALKQYTDPKTTVVREGMELVILSEELVPGDIIILEEGNRVPADAIIVRSNDLSLNESVITGEALPAEKDASAGNNLVYQGSTVNSGKCYARVTSTGNNTVLGKLGKSIESVASSKTLLQQQINRFVKTMAFFGLAAFVLIWLVNYLHTHHMVQSLLLGLTLIMSAIPEEIPVALSSFMALGAYRMAKLGIITRQPQVIENLGAVSVICLDKTGTITENRMQVRLIYDFTTGRMEEVTGTTPIQNTRVLYYARLASETAPFDMMEKAIVDAYESSAGSIERNNLHMVHEYRLDGQPPMMTHVYELNHSRVIAAKGAPERILQICHPGEAVLKTIRGIVLEMGSRGYRVLGVCSVSNHHGPYPADQDDFNWQPEGLVALYDPPKKNTAGVFAQWKAAGIQIKMMTGDYAATALEIAAQAGMGAHENYLTGSQVVLLSPEQLQLSVKNTTVFARMFPEAKQKVIEALRANGDIVAMTGDGVNDGPALKSSNVGIAMGDKGTGIAKEAADLILSDDNLQRITDAIKHGRAIYENLKKAVRYIISIHIPIILTASLPLLAGWKYPNIFTPVHIIFLELIMGPTCSIFFEREPVEDTIMKRKPRQTAHSMFSGEELLISIVQGLVIATGILLLYYCFMYYRFSIEYTRTMVFTTLLLCNVWLTFVNRSFEATIATTSRYKNSLVPFVLTASAVFFGVALFVPPVQRLFGLTSISVPHFLLCMGVSIAAVLWFEVYKMNLKNRQLI